MTGIQYLKTNCPEPLRKPLSGAYHMMRGLPYRFDMALHRREMKVFCPCCGLRFRSFTAGNHRTLVGIVDISRYMDTRQDVLCPYCRALPRHRILALWCEKHREVLRRSSILYFAPEHSMQLWMRRNKVSIVTADLFRPADLKLDIQRTGLAAASYDAVFCNHVLEHVDDFRAALREVHRILRPGGMFLCSFPMDPKIDLPVDEDPAVVTAEGRIRRFGQIDHQRVFGMKADRFLTDAGFLVEPIRGEDYPDEILPVVGPADYDWNLLFCCRKAAHEI